MKFERVLITGGTGFVGKHLVKRLMEYGYNDFIITTHDIRFNGYTQKEVKVVKWNSNDPKRIFSIINNYQPKTIIHLAAQSSVSMSWREPEETYQTNVILTISLLESLIKQKNIKRILLVGSSEEYGYIMPELLPVKETYIGMPMNPYGLSKSFQNNLGRFYYEIYRLPIIMTRSFNHIGPGQNPNFVIPQFCKQAVEIKEGKVKDFITGDTSVKRDFTDVRDVVEAYIALLEKGNNGESYNVCSGKSISLNEIINIIADILSININKRIDSRRLRIIENPDIYGDIGKIKSITGWSPKIKIYDTLSDMIY